jgi:CheY-like chemotaxis protein/DNA-binding XRE family transcriptional regulator
MAKRLDPVSVKIDSDLQRRLGLAVCISRQHLGLTQEELAWRANLNRSYVADIERGARNVTLRTLATLAAALELTVENLIANTSNPLGAPAALGAEGISPGGGEILLVEDTATDAALVVRAFKRSKLTNRVNLVRDAEGGLAYLLGTGRYAKHRPSLPSLILLDVNLPRMSGLEFLQRIKADEHLRSIPVVVLTVSRNDHIVFECAKLSVADYLVKPLEIESLVRLMPRLNLQLTIGAGPLVGRPAP